MTVCLETKKLRWNGLSTDAKPDEAPEGSEYHAVDTGEQYIYYDGMWVRDLRLMTAIQAV